MREVTAREASVGSDPDRLRVVQIPVRAYLRRIRRDDSFKQRDPQATTVAGEFIFELRVCQWLERRWPLEGRETTFLVARQLGTQRRRWDTVVIECDPDGLAARGAFGEQELDSDLLHVVRNAPPEMAWYRDALPDPGYPWRYVREAVHRAAGRGLIETCREGNRIQIRRKQPYPDWVERIIAIENKPDLDASAARVLTQQLEHDVALALADEVWLATRATGDRVEPALLEEIPMKAGILTVEPTQDADDIDIAWYPRRLPSEAVGTRIIDRPADTDRVGASASFEYVDPGTKARTRLEIAERAYGRGWRSYIDAMRPDCRRFDMDHGSGATLPYCRAKETHQTSTECCGSCPEFEPEPPGWRQRGWPIKGGPGAAVKRILARQRRRHRPGLPER